MQTLQFFITYMLEPLALLLFAAALGFYTRRVDDQRRFRVLSLYYLLGAVIMVQAAVVVYTADANNNYYYNLLVFLTGVAHSYFFFTLFPGLIKRLVSVAVGVAVLVYFVFVSNQEYFDSMAHVLTASGIVILIFLYFHQIIKNVTERPLSMDFDFWYVCVLLVYQLGSFAIFLSYNYFTHIFLQAGSERARISSILTYLWVVHNVILFLGAVVIGFGSAWIYRRKLPSS